MVRHHSTPKKHQMRALINPPQIIQIKFPRHDIFSPPLLNNMPNDDHLLHDFFDPS